MNKNSIRIGTRGSQLALYQAKRTQKELIEKFPGLSVEIEVIKTKGDKILDVALSKIGDKGLFTKEIENALLEGTVDIAVHSLKDLPTVLPNGLKLGAVLERGEFRDALVSKDGRKLSELTPDDTIATSSLRRKAALLRINKNFKIVEFQTLQTCCCHNHGIAVAFFHFAEAGVHISADIYNFEIFVDFKETCFSPETGGGDGIAGSKFAEFPPVFAYQCITVFTSFKHGAQF